MTQFTTKEQMLDVLQYLYPREKRENLEDSIRDWGFDFCKKQIVINSGHTFAEILKAIVKAGLDVNHVIVSCDANILLCIDNYDCHNVD